MSTEVAACERWPTEPKPASAAILDLALALTTLLPVAATHARDAADRRASTEDTRLATIWRRAGKSV